MFRKFMQTNMPITEGTIHKDDSHQKPFIKFMLETRDKYFRKKSSVFQAQYPHTIHSPKTTPFKRKIQTTHKKQFKIAKNPKEAYLKITPIKAKEYFFTDRCSQNCIFAKYVSLKKPTMSSFYQSPKIRKFKKDKLLNTNTTNTNFLQLVGFNNGYNLRQVNKLMNDKMELRQQKQENYQISRWNFEDQY